MTPEWLERRGCQCSPLCESIGAHEPQTHAQRAKRSNKGAEHELQHNVHLDSGSPLLCCDETCHHYREDKNRVGVVDGLGRVWV